MLLIALEAAIFQQFVKLHDQGAYPEYQSVG